VQLVSGVMLTPTMFSQGRCSVCSAGPTTQCALRVVSLHRRGLLSWEEFLAGFSIMDEGGVAV
jgi:hypothetical protein